MKKDKPLGAGWVLHFALAMGILLAVQVVILLFFTIFSPFEGEFFLTDSIALIGEFQCGGDNLEIFLLIQAILYVRPSVALFLLQYARAFVLALLCSCTLLHSCRVCSRVHAAIAHFISCVTPGCDAAVGFGDGLSDVGYVGFVDGVQMDPHHCLQHPHHHDYR
jgi:hypothetical protein